MHDDRSPLDALIARMSELHRASGTRGREARQVRMRTAFLTAAKHAAAQPRRSRMRWVYGGAVLLAASLLLAWTLRPRTLTVEIDEETTLAQLVFDAEEHPVTLAFSDGTRVVAAPRARVKVQRLREDGADLVLLGGTLDAELESEATVWQVQAGAYRVEASSATVTVHWKPAEETLALEVEAGTATVTGPGIASVRRLEAGERATFSSERRAVALAPTLPEAPAVALEDASAEPPKAALHRGGRDGRDGRRRARSSARASASHEETTPLPAPPEAVQAPATDWRALGRDGAYARAFAAAEAEGFADLCRSLDADALLELADVSRYARRPHRAREALETLRRRFPGTPSAATAAFDLGRLAALGNAGCADAVPWYRTFLDERGQGSMVAEARRRIAACESEPSSR